MSNIAVYVYPESISKRWRYALFISHPLIHLLRHLFSHPLSSMDGPIFRRCKCLYNVPFLFRSSASPISRKTFAIGGFFANRLNYQIIHGNPYRILKLRHSFLIFPSADFNFNPWQNVTASLLSLILALTFSNMLPGLCCRRFFIPW